LGLVTTAYLVVQFTADAYLRAAGLVMSGAVLFVAQTLVRRRSGADSGRDLDG
jgi:hypothetical protein